MYRNPLIYTAFLILCSCGEFETPPDDEKDDQDYLAELAECDSVCEHVYDRCLASLKYSDQSGFVDRADCVDECMNGLIDGNRSCLAEVECQGHYVEACQFFPSGEIEITGSYLCDLDGEWPEHWERQELEVLVLINERRAAGALCGDSNMSSARPLKMERTLWCAARRYSRKMVDGRFFAHECPDGIKFDERILDEGYRGRYPLGENLAMGQYTPLDVVNGWMSSPGHCKNIMNPDFRDIGIGFDDSSRGHARVWTQKFGGGN